MAITDAGSRALAIKKQNIINIHVCNNDIIWLEDGTIIKYTKEIEAKHINECIGLSLGCSICGQLFISGKDF